MSTVFNLKKNYLVINQIGDSNVFRNFSFFGRNLVGKTTSCYRLGQGRCFACLSRLRVFSLLAVILLEVASDEGKINVLWG